MNAIIKVVKFDCGSRSTGYPRCKRHASGDTLCRFLSRDI